VNCEPSSRQTGAIPHDWHKHHQTAIIPSNRIRRARKT
jgi:hypothetical protein